MRNFTSQVKRQLPDIDIELAEELARDLEERYRARMLDGDTDTEAWAGANTQMDWARLAREFSPGLQRKKSPLFRLLPDFRFARRQLIRNPGFASTAILILSIAIGANTAIFSAFDAMVLHPLPYPHPGQLVSITEDFSKFDVSEMQLSSVELDDLRTMTNSFSDIAGIASGEFAITGNGAAESVSGLRVSASIFPMLGVQPLIGSPFRTGDEEFGKHRVVVISEALWRRRFAADPNIVGTSIEINREPYRVAGVSRPFLDYLGTKWDLWVPLSFQLQDKTPTSRNAKGLDVVARLKLGVSIAQASQELAATSSRLSALYPRAYPKDVGFSIRATELASTIARELQQPLLYLLAAVGILMLIACANVSNLLMARSSVRKREISIRSALGAGRSHIIRQLMTESLVIAGVSGILGVALAQVLLRLFEIYGPTEVIRVAQLGINGWVVTFAIGVSSLSSILFGLFPALTTSSELNDVLKESARGTTSGRRLFRESMVALEVAASVVLLISAGLLIRSFVRVQQVDPGFNPKNVLTFELLLPVSPYSEPERRIALYEEFRSRIQAIPGVISAGAASRIPFALQGGNLLQVVGRPVDPNVPQPMYRPARILPGYFEAMGVPLLRGREFTTADVSNTPTVAIIDDAAAARLFPDGEDPIGKQVIGGESGLTATIVGVVGSVKRRDLSTAAEMSVYHAATQRAGSAMTFTVKTAADPLAMIPAIRHELAQIDPLLPLTRTVTMEQRISNSLARRRLALQLMMFFGSAALVLAAIGLYGVLSYTVQQRRKEVGIRIALGARPGKVVGMVAKQGLLPVALGMAAGLAAAFAASRLLTTVLYEVSPNDPLVYGLVTGLLVLTALTATAVPASRAATVDPLVALRDE